MNCAADMPDPDMLVFINEVAKNRWMSACKYGCSRRGVCCCVSRYFVQGKRFTILSTIILNDIITYDISLKDQLTINILWDFLEEHVGHLYYFTCTILIYCWYRCLLPTHILVSIVLCIIMDNCHIHKIMAVCALVEDMYYILLMFCSSCHCTNYYKFASLFSSPLLF